MIFPYFLVQVQDLKLGNLSPLQNFQICSILPPLSPVAAGCEFRRFLDFYFHARRPPPNPPASVCLLEILV
ncbi:hypothetical protein SLEP1_g39434 [Rubroshorea leprosula]|uniref:Uncharacterized protein n=1 Tax=Rubroshorea leprosula TaxID=152421 RepID=A0AAV5L0U4_9ROSI|nr:hypothetical protein SLEP1_g39434 [Rubroshorea leprosula]